MSYLMMATGGWDDIVAKAFSECGLVASLLISAILYLSLRLGQVTKLWESANEDAVKRLESANATIVKLVESSNESDRAYAVSLNRLEVMLAAAQARNGRS
jgi:hypothetical protein